MKNSFGGPHASYKETLNISQMATSQKMLNGARRTPTTKLRKNQLFREAVDLKIETDRLAQR